MFELSVDGDFSSAHCLKGYKGDCSRLHGHTWRVRVTVGASDTGPLGMAVDFKLIAAKLDETLSLLDHRNLNDLEFFADSNPTAERIAKFIFDRIEGEFSGAARILSVTVAESDRYRATYRRKAESE